ncbi:MAG: amidohydrolase family protein [Gammaproteobacteria bacterium]|nr:amidohydrolase family protein [Gammaproteobacteria bacterium]MBI3171782.1 amidohydrolase family protein [Hydrocarboniphaga effusa]
MKLRPIVAACAVLLANAAPAAETLRYVVLVDGGKKAGEQIVEIQDDGWTKVRYSFKENGRGPELEETFRLAADGTFAEYHVKGNSTYGAVVDERYSRNGNKADWRSTSENGGVSVDDTAQYVPLNGTLAAASATLAAASQRGDKPLPLLPGGRLTQRVVDEVDLDGRRVQLLAQTGVDLKPTFLWATTEPKPRLFAFIIPGYMLHIEDGAEKYGKLLTERQKTAETRVLRDMAGRLAKPLDGLTVIRNARIFDSETAKLGGAADVYVLRGRITAVRQAGSPAHGAEREIDAAGRVLLPGLFDMHGHLSRWEGGLHLAAGVTTVRDLGNDNETLQQLIDETGRGELLSPHIVPAGFLEGESPFAARSGFVVKDLQAAKNAIDWYAEHGYPQLKIYNSFPRELVRDTVAYAHSRGLRVGGHVPAFMRAEDVVAQGFDELHHINQLMLNFFVTDTTDTRTLERFYLPAEKTAALDFGSKPVQDFLGLLKAKNVVVDPTLATFDFLRQRDGELSKAYAAIADHMPLQLQRGFRVGTMKIPDEATAKRYDASYAKMVEFVRLIYKSGIPLVAGTDEIAGFTLQRELELYVQAGLTPGQALQIATLNGARYSRTLADRGSIAPGKQADLVLVDGDPTKDIGDLRKIALVISQGKLISPSEVYAALGIKPFTANAPGAKLVAKR